MKLTDEILKIYYMECRNKRLSKHTLKAYRIDLRQTYEYFIGKEMDKNSIMEYIECLNDRYKSKTVKRKLASMHALLEHLVFDEIIDANPMDKLRYKIKEEKIIPKTINVDDLEGIMTKIYQDKKRNSFLLRDQAVIELLISTGIRVSELCSLKASDIDFRQRYVKVYGKGSRERIIFLGESVYKALTMYYKRFSRSIEENNYFFVNNDYRPINDQNIRSIITKYKPSSSCHITPHMFRHTFATLLLEQGVDIAYIQKILGHSSITTTAIYTNATTAKQRDILMHKNPRGMIKI